MRVDIKRLKSNHKQILNLKVAGMRDKDIATALGMSPSGVGLVVRSPLFQEALARRQASVDERVDEAIVDEVVTERRKAMDILRENAASAAATQVKLLTEGSASVRLRASDSILDRVFGRAPQQGSEGEGKGQVVINTECVQLLQLAMQESTESV